MRTRLLPWFVTLGLAALLTGQAKPSPKPVSKQAPPAAVSVVGATSAVKYDDRGWPILPGDSAPEQKPAAPAVEPARMASDVRTPPPSTTVPRSESQQPTSNSGMQLGSPLLEVFQATRSPGEFKALGGVSIWWRLTIYGEQGEVIGMREVTQVADSAYAERDRLEYADGRVYGRIGASVFAERAGMPFATLSDEAQVELMLFGLQWRLPWCFGDANAYAVLSRDVVQREERSLNRIVIERRPPPEFDVAGPELDPKPRDHFELVFEPGSGTPIEFVHRFASNHQSRRCLLEDWQDFHGVSVPRRRVYVDESLRQTTTMEILRLEQVRTGERDFRLR